MFIYSIENATKKNSIHHLPHIALISSILHYSDSSAFFQTDSVLAEVVLDGVVGGATPIDAADTVLFWVVGTVSQSSFVAPPPAAVANDGLLELCVRLKVLANFSSFAAC